VFATSLSYFLKSSDKRMVDLSLHYRHMQQRSFKSNEGMSEHALCLCAIYATCMTLLPQAAQGTPRLHPTNS